MKLKISVITALSFIIIFSAFSQPHANGKMVKELMLTDQQQEQFDKITFDSQKKMIELNAKAATSKLELRRLMDTDPLDKSAIEKKMNEIAAHEVAIRMNHINGWLEKNKILTPEQQKIWKKALAHRPEQMKREKMMHREMLEDMDSSKEQDREVIIERRMKN